MADPLTLALLGAACLTLLAACEFERDPGQALPQIFAGAETKLLANDLVEVSATVLRPRPGSLRAYTDCVASQYTLIRGMAYARRVISSENRSGLADAVRERTTYLISPLRPDGPFVLTATEVVAKCRAAGIPTV